MTLTSENLHLQLHDVLYFDEYNKQTRTKMRSFCALSLRIESDSEIIIRDETIHMTSRDLALFPANLPYLRKARRDRMIVFHFSISNRAPHELEVLHDFEYDSLLPLFTEALELWRARSPGYYYKASAILNEIFAHICSHACTHTTASLSSPSPQIAAALAYIDEGYADTTLSVETLARLSHMSGTYFRQLFVREMGITPKRYITNLRLEHAQTLLNAGYDTVAAVAEKVGFRDSKNFATAFKARFGYPPSKQTYEP